MSDFERRGGIYLCEQGPCTATGELFTVEELLEDDLILVRYKDGSTDILSSDGMWV